MLSNTCRLYPVTNLLSTKASVSLVWDVKLAACCLFTVSGLMNMWETQPSWRKLRPDLIGWWVGLFKMVGAVGFVVCSVFGIRSEKATNESKSNEAAIQAAIHALWGESAAVFIGE